MANIETFSNSSNSSVKVPYFSISFGNFNLTPVPPKYIKSVSVKRYEDDNAGTFEINLVMPLATFEKNSVSSKTNFTTVLSTMIAASQNFDDDTAKMTFYYGWQHGAGCIVKDAVISTFEYGISLDASNNSVISYKIGGAATKITNRMFEKHFYTISDASSVLNEINKITNIVDDESSGSDNNVPTTLDENAKLELIKILNDPCLRLSYPNGFTVTYRSSPRDNKEATYTYWDITKSNASGIRIKYADSVSFTPYRVSNNLDQFSSNIPIPENMSPTYDNLGRFVPPNSTNLNSSVLNNSAANSILPDVANFTIDATAKDTNSNSIESQTNTASSVYKLTSITNSAIDYSASQRALLSASYGTSFRISYFVERLAKYLYGDVYANIEVEHSDHLYDINTEFDDIYNIILGIKNIDTSYVTLKELLNKLVSLCYTEDTQDESGSNKSYYQIKFDYTHNGGTVWIGVNNVKDLDPKVYIISNNYKTEDVISFSVDSNGLPGYASIMKVLNTSNAGVEASSGLCFVTKTDTGGKVPLDRASADTMSRSFLSKVAGDISQNTSSANITLFGSNATINTTIGKTTLRIMPLLNGGETLWCGDYIVKEIHDEVNSQGYITTLVLTFDKSKFYDKALAAYSGLSGVNVDAASTSFSSQGDVFVPNSSVSTNSDTIIIWNAEGDPQPETIKRGATSKSSGDTLVWLADFTNVGDIVNPTVNLVNDTVKPKNKIVSNMLTPNMPNILN